MNPIPFNRPPITGVEIEYLKHVIESRHLTGDGAFTKRCHAWLESNLQSPKALLTHSCTASLEMAALLCEIEPGDEVIMPSFTFVSTANAFALRGATAVFVDIDPDTQNLDASLIEPALTNRTKAIVPVHYAGISCDMDAIGSIARCHNLKLVEDAAQGLGSTWRGKALGTLGDYGALSFHGTKNIVSGEGGALLVREPERGERAEIIREKGTDRSRFIRGEVDKYTWQELGSSYLPSELIAAFLYAQLEDSHKITERRVAAWTRYHEGLQSLESAGRLRRPIVPEHAVHNGHIYYVLLPDEAAKQRVHQALADCGIQSSSHYVSLHESPAGKRHGRVASDMTVTRQTVKTLLRLPMYADLTWEQQERVIKGIADSC